MDNLSANKKFIIGNIKNIYLIHNKEDEEHEGEEQESEEHESEEQEHSEHQEATNYHLWLDVNNIQILPIMNFLLALRLSIAFFNPLSKIG
jgi:ABC-type Zn2+ transport system substrate-binding protein/surface adhesin